MTFGTVATVVGIAGGINSLTGGGITSALGLGPSTPSGSQAQSMVDPFAPYRANLGQMYSGLVTGQTPYDPARVPGAGAFKTGVLDPALAASKRSAAASGMMYSGGEEAALGKIGQQGYYGFMTDYLNRLATGSGAGYAPSDGGKAGLSAIGSQQQGISQGIGALAQNIPGLKGIFGSDTGIGTGMTGLGSTIDATGGGVLGGSALFV